MTTSNASNYRPERPDVSSTTLERLATLGAWLDRRRKRGRWLVLTHDNPDPDALTAAVIIAKILRQRFHQQATVAYGGMIGRAENQALVSLLNLRVSRMRHINLKNYRHVAMLDCQPGTGNTQLPPSLLPDLVLDHHPRRPQTNKVAVHDLRDGYGATATIAAEYLLASELPITRKEATAIVYALRSETLDFSREFPGPDRQIYDYFLSLADTRLLGKIQNPRLPEDYFRTLHEALEHLKTVDTLVTSSLGPVSQPDIVPEIADLLLRMHGKTWSLCSGHFEDRIYLSIRTTNPRANAARIIQRMLGRHGKCGGHGMLAGGWIPADAEVAAKIQLRLERRFATLLRKKPDKMLRLDFASTNQRPEPSLTRSGEVNKAGSPLD